MREIKFRAWRHSENEPWMAYPDNEQVFAYDESIGHPIMQYTGLRDKNGKEIYEGDILHYFLHHVNYLIEFKIDDNEGGACEFVCEQKKAPHNYMLPSVWKEMEVVGNIYENPELLEAKA